MKLLLAGMESKSNRELALRFRVPAILVSAYYLRGSPDTLKQIIKDFEFVMIDSGAFTFNARLSQYDEDKGITEKSSESEKRRFYSSDETVAFRASEEKARAEWADQYLRIVKEIAVGNPNVVYVEFDSGHGDEVWLRRHKWLREGTSPLLVWHAGQRKEIFEAMCAHVPYVGLGGMAQSTSKFRAQQFSWAVSLAKRFGTKIHGFGMTQQEPMRRVPMFSVDSTSWLSGARFGVHYEYRGGRLRVWDKNYKKERKRLRRQVEELGIDPKGFEGDDSNALNTWNLSQWARLAADVANSHVKRAQEYWHSPSFTHKRMRYYSLGDDAPGRYRAMDSVEYALATTGVFDHTAPNGPLPLEIALSPETPFDKDTRPVKEKHGKMSTIVDETPASAQEPEDEEDEGAEEGEEEAGEGPSEEEGGEAAPPALPGFDAVKAAAQVKAGGGVLECDKCAISERCFAMRKGGLCTILPDTEVTPGNFLGVFRQLLTLQHRRVVRIAHFEATEGGMVDSALSGEMRQLVSLMSGYNVMHHNLDTAGQGQPALPTDGEEVEVTVKARGGVLSNLLSGITGNTRRGQSQAARVSAEVDEHESRVVVEAKAETVEE